MSLRNGDVSCDPAQPGCARHGVNFTEGESACPQCPPSEQARLERQRTLAARTQARAMGVHKGKK